jgi:hypothetical protein
MKMRLFFHGARHGYFASHNHQFTLKSVSYVRERCAKRASATENAGSTEVFKRFSQDSLWSDMKKRPEGFWKDGNSG